MEFGKKRNPPIAPEIVCAWHSWNQTRGWMMPDAAGQMVPIQNPKGCLISFAEKLLPPPTLDRITHKEFWAWAEEQGFDEIYAPEWIKLQQRNGWKRLNPMTGMMESVFDFKASLQGYCAHLESCRTGESTGTARGRTRKKKSSKAQGTREEVIAFCLDNGLTENDGEWFFDKHEGNGWTNGHRRIKDWKAIVRKHKIAGYFISQRT